MTPYEIKEKIVRKGESKIFANWKELVPALTEDEFLENLRWVCDDPCENGDGTGRLTREIGLTKDGIVHLWRANGLITVFRRKDGSLWSGDVFTVPFTEKFIKNADKHKKQYGCETIDILYKIGLSARDRV